MTPVEGREKEVYSATHPRVKCGVVGRGELGRKQVGCLLEGVSRMLPCYAQISISMEVPCIQCEPPVASEEF